LQDCGVAHSLRVEHLSRLLVMPPSTFDVNWLQVQPERLPGCHHSNGGLRISGWIGQLSCLTIFSTSLSVAAFLRMAGGSKLESMHMTGPCTVHMLNILCLALVFIRSTSKSRPNNIRGKKCLPVRPSVRPSVRPYVRPSTKSFFNLNESWYIGRGRRVMHDGMPYGRIEGQGQGHEPFKV